MQLCVKLKYILKMFKLRSNSEPISVLLQQIKSKSFLAIYLIIL